MSVDTAQRTESIKDLAEYISKSSIVLPEFQRDFVWEIGKTYDLFDSLIRDIFIGAIIYGIPTFEISIREFDFRPRKGTDKRRKSLQVTSFTKKQIREKVEVGNFRLLLDGQQRITSIYRALIGIDPVWFIFKNEEVLEEKVVNTPVGERLLEDVLFEVTGKEAQERLSINISDVYKMLELKIKREKEKAGILAKSQYVSQLQISNVESSDIFERYLAYSEKIQDLFKSEKLLSYYLLNTNEEKFSLFFERSNSKGVQLSFIDILAAKLYSGFNLRRASEDFKDKNGNIDLNVEVIVRAIALIISNFKAINRSFILTNLTHVHFNDHWNNLCQLYVKCLNFLYDNNFLLSLAWNPYDTMLVPLMMLLRELPNQQFSQLTQDQLDVIKVWWWGSILTQRYTSTTNEIIIHDSRFFKKLASGEYKDERNILKRLNPDIEEVDDLILISRKGNPLYRGILNFINYQAKGIVDWKNNSRLTFNKKLEAHHIFPRDFLKSKYKGAAEDKEPNLVNSVMNIALVPKITNIQIKDKAPSQYLAELGKENDRLDQTLNSHLIPSELKAGRLDDQFGEFLEKRGKLILDSIRDEIVALLEKIKQLFSEYEA